ncbi:hypothetical protein [Insolitispirillum peregrinum]|uniref:hypothetical protein n=1 Tax=Insolitispirillum peregrinum TaxID=80876 RepID=UPI00361B86DC
MNFKRIATVAAAAALVVGVSACGEMKPEDKALLNQAVESSKAAAASAAKAEKAADRAEAAAARAEAAAAKTEKMFQKGMRK